MYNIATCTMAGTTKYFFSNYGNTVYNIFNRPICKILFCSKYKTLVIFRKM